ncbi:MAG TPA: TerC/Alx family metal homeostasis membrane protein [Candidatus Baltobacteraceae bacterium]|nr:TerC/Alx family metal homeostasis membrane protein [Candidatus Baltobacteraceae bacterium]
MVVWVAFGALVAAAITADLTVFRPRTDRVTLRHALVESAAWVALALGFGLWIYLSRGRQAGVEFLASYVLEKSLSADNIFVFLILFRTFGVGPRAQHRVLYTGIVGAVILRLAFVLTGIALLEHFHVVAYLFGAILVIAGANMLRSGKEAPRAECNWLIRLLRKIMPVASSSGGEHFWVRDRDRWSATPLLVALIAIEVMDVVFAADSVPAVLSITRDPFIAYSSNVFAILGLRAMYFALADIMTRLRFLHEGLAVILLFTGAKMLVADRFAIPAFASLGVIVAILAITAAASYAAPRRS